MKPVAARTFPTVHQLAVHYPNFSVGRSCSPILKGGLLALLSLAGFAVTPCQADEGSVQAPVEAKEAATLQWFDAMPAALEKAKAERKSVLVDFTGTDWCPACIHLRTKIMDTPEFAAHAKDRYVMLELDFPRDLKKYSPEKQAANEVFRAQYGVDSFPTVLLLDSDGLPYAEMAGAAKDTSEYLSRLAEAEAILKKRNAAWEKVAGSQGLEEAKLLDAMLQTVPDALRRHYEKVIVTIVANDLDDTLGYSKNMAKDNLRLQQKAAFEKLLASGQSKNQPEQLVEQVKLWNEFVETPDLDKDVAQPAWYHLAFLQAMRKDYAANVECLRKAYEVSPESDQAPRIKRWLDHNEKNLPKLLEQSGRAEAEPADKTGTPPESEDSTPSE